MGRIDLMAYYKWLGAIHFAKNTIAIAENDNKYDLGKIDWEND